MAAEGFWILPPKVLITGAGGQLGRFLTRYLHGRYDLLLTDQIAPEDCLGHPFLAADIADLDALRPVFSDVEMVVHLAAEPDPEAPWERLLPANIVGLHNVFEAARQAGCRRVIFASSINAVAAYPGEQQVRTSMPVRPYNLYGATKAWGEAVASYYADRRGLAAICIRIGWVRSRDSADLRPDHPYLPFVLIDEDFGQLIERSLTAPAHLRFGIFHGVSNNRWKRLDISDAREVLGYAPRFDAFELAEQQVREQGPEKGAR
jgi:NAD(P)-dependent dehydrogenase (short-subunit alcohol dehydrogenase family)